MRFLSLFDGIGAASCAWIPLGWKCVASAEIDPFPSAVTKCRYPEVPHLGDITKITEEQIQSLGQIDLVVGGFPCQDLSIAGKRKGLIDQEGNKTRSGLFFDAMRIVRWARPRFLLIENVPGLFSSNRGGDFAAVLGEMVGVPFDVPDGGWENSGLALGPLGLAEWVTLDAQFFGVPQRRRRIFALADFGDWRSRTPVLFERHSLSGHPPPRREAGKGSTYDIAPCIGASGRGFERTGDTRGQDCLIASTGEISHCLNAGGMGRQDYETETLVISPLTCNPYADNESRESLLVTHSLRADGFDASEDGTGRGTPLVPIAIQERAICENPDAGPDGAGFRDDGTAYTLEARTVPQAVAFDTTQITSAANYSNPKPGDPCHPLAAGAHSPALATTMAVRRLTPRECERLQGFPDDYTLIPYRGKAAADGPRYKALGNSMAVPVMAWIGQRIAAVEAL